MRGEKIQFLYGWWNWKGILIALGKNCFKSKSVSDNETKKKSKEKLEKH